MPFNLSAIVLTVTRHDSINNTYFTAVSIAYYIRYETCTACMSAPAPDQC